MNTAISIQGLHKSFGEVGVLRGVDLEVPEGTVFGLLAPDTGQVRVAGYDPVREADAVRASIGLTSQFAAVDVLETLRAAGVSEWALWAERDGWLLILARYPVRGRELLLGKISWLADPAALRQYVLYDQAQHWDPDDPRLREGADEIIRAFRPAEADPDCDDGDGDNDDQVGEGGEPTADLPEGWQEEDAEPARMLAVLFTAAKTPALLRLEEMLGAEHPG